MLTWEQWLQSRGYSVDMLDELEPEGLKALQDQYSQYTGGDGNGGGDGTPPELNQVMAELRERYGEDFADWALSQHNEGKINLLSVGREALDPLFGRWEAGEFDDEKPPEPPVVPDDDDFSQQLGTAVEAYQRQIREMGERERAEALRLGARNIGQMSRAQQNALLAQGRSAGEIEQLMAGGMEAGSRSMADLIQQLNIGEQRQLAGAEQFGIGTMISGEQLEQRQREMMQGAGQYQQSLAEQIRQFNQAQAQQAGQFGQQFGLSQQQLAQQAGQFGQTMDLGQLQAQYGFWGDIAGGVGSFLGGLFG